MEEGPRTRETLELLWQNSRCAGTAAEEVRRQGEHMAKDFFNIRELEESGESGKFPLGREYDQSPNLKDGYDFATSRVRNKMTSSHPSSFL